VKDSDLVLIDTGIWSAFFTKPGSPEKHSVDILLDEDRVGLSVHRACGMREKKVAMEVA